MMVEELRPSHPYGRLAGICVKTGILVISQFPQVAQYTANRPLFNGTTLTGGVTQHLTTMSHKMQNVRDETLTAEHHDFQFRGIWIPAEIVHLVGKQLITPREYILLTVVDSLVDVRGKGCWASNSYLSKQVGCQPRHISGMVGRLKKLGLILEISDGKNGMERLLETKWSRVHPRADCEVGPTGPGGVGPTGPGGRACRPTNKDIDKERIQFIPSASHCGMNSGKETESMAGFFATNTTKQNNTTPSSSDCGCATKLHDAIVNKLTIRKRWSHKSWSNEFRLLRSELDGNETRIATVLDWFITHIKDQYVPLCHCAATFRKKFAQVEAAMLRDHSINPPAAPVSDKAKKVISALKALRWPKGGGDHIPQMVQTGMDEHERIKARLQQTLAAIKAPGAKRLGFTASFVQHIITKMGSPATMLENWFRSVHGRVTAWDEWSGDMKMFRFHIESKDFQRMGKSWQDEFTSDGKAWAKLMEVVK